MKGTALSDALDELGVDRDNFRVLGLLPLVYVAWADGNVHAAQRSLIHRLAKMNGWLGDEGDALLTEWLDEPPSEEYVASGLEVLRSLSSQTVTAEQSLDDLLAYCREVALAAGGLFGNRDPVTDVEDEALSDIAGALGVSDGKRWQAINSSLEPAEDQPSDGPKGHILVGNLLDFNTTPLAFLLDAANNYGDIVHFTVQRDEVYLLRHPDHVKQVLIDDTAQFRRGAEYRALAEVLGPSLLTEEGEPWTRLRKLAGPAFEPKRIDAFAKTIVSCTDATLERWTVGDEVDVRAEMSRLVLDIVGQFVFSRSLGDPTEPLSTPVRAILEHASHAMENPFLLHETSPARRRRFSEAMETFSEVFTEVIVERRTKGALSEDLLGQLLTADDITDRELESNVLAFLLGGHDTTAVALTWIFDSLSRHAVPARRACREVRDKLRARKPTHRDARQCTYTNMFIDEVLRLYPPIWSIDREARKDLKVGDVTIPKGSVVMLSPWVTHRSKAVFVNPEGFDPERFTERTAAKRAPGAYFPFGAGAHSCIAQHFARLMLRLIVPRISQHYRLDLVAGCEPRIDAQLTLEPKTIVRALVRAV